MIENTNNEENLSRRKFISFGKTNGDAEILARTEKEIGYPCFVKPSNSESSIGVSVAQNVHQLREGIVKAFRHDDFIVVGQEAEPENEVGFLC